VLPKFVDVASLSGVGTLTVAAIVHALAIVALSGLGVLSTQTGPLHRPVLSLAASMGWDLEASATVWSLAASMGWEETASV
jgi:hypothetical protein